MEEAAEGQGPVQGGVNRRRRLVLSALVAVAALVAAAVVAVAVLGGDDDEPRGYTAELLATDPLLVEHTVVERLTCPDGRGESPLANADHAQGRQVVEAGYATGQLAPFTLRLDADPALTEPAVLVFDATLSDSLVEGVQCAFVDTADPAAAERRDAVPATVRWDPDADTLTVDGVDAGETVVVELWATLAPPPGVPEPDRTRLSMDLVPRPELPVEAVALAFDVDFRRGGLSDDQPTVVVSSAQPSVGLDEQATQTVVVTNTSSVEPLSAAVITGSLDMNATIVDLAVVDDTAASTTCTTDATSYTCDAVFLAPEETIELTITLRTTAADLPEGFTTIGGSCDDRVPRVCHEAELQYLDTFDVATVSADAQVTVVSSGDTFNVFVLSQDPEQARVGSPISLELSVALTDPNRQADTVQLESSVCDQPPAILRGDIDDDLVMGGDEVWVYGCASLELSATSTLTVVKAEIDDSVEVQEATELQLQAIDPSMELRLIPVVRGTVWELENMGDVPLTDVVLQPSAESTCTPAFDAGDDNADGVLDPGEVWEFSCDQAGGDAIAYASDPFGSSVQARVASE